MTTLLEMPKRSNPPWTKPLDGETGSAFACFRAWIDAGCPKLSQFHKTRPESYAAIRKLSATFLWDARRKARDVHLATATDDRIRQLRDSTTEKLLTQTERIVDQVANNSSHGVSESQISKLRAASSIMKDLASHHIDPGQRAAQKNQDFLEQLTGEPEADPEPEAVAS